MTFLPSPPRRSSFFVRFWRGEYTLPVSYWVIGLAFNVATIGAIWGVAFATREQAFNPYAIAITLFALWGVTAIVLVYQSVGVWRSATRYRKAPGRPAWRGMWGVAAQLSVLAGIVSFGHQLWQSGVR